MGQGKESNCEYTFGPMIIEMCHLVIDYPLRICFFPQRDSPHRNHAAEQSFVSWGPFPQRKGFF